MKFTKQDFIDLIPYAVLFTVGVYWVFNSDAVKADPYTLGLFRGICYPMILYKYLQRAFL